MTKPLSSFSLFLCALCLSLPAQALHYDFRVGHMELPDDYVIVEEGDDGPTKYFIRAQRDYPRTGEALLLTTLVYEYTAYNEELITEDNAFKRLRSYMSDTMKAIGRRTHIVHQDALRVVYTDDRPGLATMYFATTPDDSEYIGLVLCTYHGDHIVTFSIVQTGSIDASNILDLVKLIEGYSSEPQ